MSSQVAGPVFMVDATPEEFKLKVASERSKLRRDCGQLLLPRYVLDACREQIDATVADETAKDPDAARKKVLERFFSIGIDAAMLRSYMGYALDALTVKDIAELQVIFTSLRDGECTWEDVVRIKTAPAEGEEQQAGAKPADPLRDKIMSARETRKAAAKPEEETKA